MEDCATISTAPKKTYGITKANAKELSALAHKARWHTPKPVLIPSQETSATLALPKDALALPVDEFRDGMLINVRSKIQSILARMDAELEADELDSKVLKELTDALYRFETMEQKLSMRSAPAAMKPTQSKQPKSRPSHASPTFIDESPAAPINDPNEPNG